MWMTGISGPTLYSTWWIPIRTFPESSRVAGTLMHDSGTRSAIESPAEALYECSRLCHLRILPWIEVPLLDAEDPFPTDPGRDAERAAGEAVLAVKHARAGEHLPPVFEDRAYQHDYVVRGAEDRAALAADHLHARPPHPGEERFPVLNTDRRAGLREERHLALAAGATHIARGYTKKVRHLKDLFKEAIMHRGFSFVDVLQICATYFNLTDYYNAHAYELAEGEVETGRFESALGKIREWDYDREAPIALGTFYSVEKPVYEEHFQALTAGKPDRRPLVRKVIEEWR